MSELNSLQFKETEKFIKSDNKIEWEGLDSWGDSSSYITDFSNKQVEKIVSTVPLTEKEIKELGLDNIYPESIVERIKTVEEAKIYIDAGLKVDHINGKDVLIRTDIDYNQVDPLGRTNLDRMTLGLAPLDRNGKPIELHHIGQNSDSPLGELTREEHTGGGNDTILHNKQKESEINRKDFQKEKEAHWKVRAEQIEQELKGA